MPLLLYLDGNKIPGWLAHVSTLHHRCLKSSKIISNQSGPQVPFFLFLFPRWMFDWPRGLFICITNRHSPYWKSSLAFFTDKQEDQNYLITELTITHTHAKVWSQSIIRSGPQTILQIMHRTPASNLRYWFWAFQATHSQWPIRTAFRMEPQKQSQNMHWNVVTWMELKQKSLIMF